MVERVQIFKHFDVIYITSFVKVSDRYFVVFFFRKYTDFSKAHTFFIVYRLSSKYVLMFYHCLNLIFRAIFLSICLKPLQCPFAALIKKTSCLNRVLTIYRRLNSNELADTLNFFSDADKAVIKHPHEKGYTAQKIWKDNPEKHWDKTSVKLLIKRTKAFGTMDRQRFWPCANSNSS